ncbi:MAG TPA: NAD(P)/FAD-dependent oxidoreductase [Candidatus Binatia bacterium]|nr:NAD(P)/FAD-dependent oxidoreductase [Candidatus Binatia bacterium]
MAHEFDALVIGGGAAGLMCAIEAGKRGRRVAVLEHSPQLGRKILISGGGRCNFTNLHCRPENFISANPHFAKSALARYTPADFIALVEKHRIPYHEKTLGQLFCDRSARDIVTLLEKECREARVEIFLGTAIPRVESAAGFRVTAESAEFHAPVLVVATGGLSVPRTGATSFGYDLARQFAIAIREPRPGLVPLLFGAGDCSRYCDLAGVSAEIIASVSNQQFREKMLVTHRGLSGPAILQISSYWNERGPVLLDLAPGAEITSVFKDPKSPRHLSTLRAELRRYLPHRLADRWLELHPPQALNNRGLAEFEKLIHAWPVTPAATEGFAKAEVTLGGVDTDELSPQTMEARKVPGLYFVGEVVDVTGHLGGFNFQWAWSSGAAAGRAF